MRESLAPVCQRPYARLYGSADVGELGTGVPRPLGVDLHYAAVSGVAFGGVREY